jgi:hypothetical protein
MVEILYNFIVSILIVLFRYWLLIYLLFPSNLYDKLKGESVEVSFLFFEIKYQYSGCSFFICLECSYHIIYRWSISFCFREGSLDWSYILKNYDFLVFRLLWLKSILQFFLLSFLDLWDHFVPEVCFCLIFY